MTIEVNISRLVDEAAKPRPAMAPHTFEAKKYDDGAQVMTTAAGSRDKPPTPEPNAEPQNKKVRVLVSDILQGGKEAILEHDGQDYRLRITANGKLILTK